jgi:DNA-binding response OmpR family regulator
MKILIAEDEEQLAHVMKAALETANNDVTAVFNGQEAVAAVKKSAYDVIILDIMMPVMDGIEALKKIRATGDKTYVIMLTAKAEIDDKVTGLDAGADDYLTKPFSLKELLARLRSLARRASEYANTQLHYGDLTLNNDEQELVSQNSIRLANKENELINYLLLNSEKEISSTELINHIWKDSSEADDRLVWLYINYLRRKLAFIQSKAKIQGQKGGPYKLTK